MPDNIAFNTIPIDIRTPGQYLEVDNAKALRGLPAMNRRMLFIGNRLPTGTAPAGQLRRINAAAEAAGHFGRGSVLYEMLAAARAANKESDIWAIGLDDLGAGVAATRTLTITLTTALPVGTIALYVNGRKIGVGVVPADSAATIAANMAATINLWADGPVTATAAGAMVTLTARHKGAFTNDIDVRVNVYPDEALPKGVAVAIANGVAGSGNPDVAAALAAISLESFYSIVTPYTDGASVAAIEAELGGRWGGMDMRTGHLFGALGGTHGALTTFGAARNSAHSSFIGAKGPSPAYVWAAVWAAVCEVSGAIDPARPMQTLALPGLLPPALGERFTRQERDLLLRDGISTFTVDQGGNVQIERVITTYQVNAFGIEDVSYLDLETKWTVDYMRYAFRARIALRFPRHKLADDGTSFAPGQAIATPNVIKGELLDVARQLELAGILEGFDRFKSGLIVQRSEVDRNRVNCILPPDVVNQFRVFAASVQFIL